MIRKMDLQLLAKYSVCGIETECVNTKRLPIKHKKNMLILFNQFMHRPPSLM